MYGIAASATVAQRWTAIVSSAHPTENLTFLLFSSGQLGLASSMENKFNVRILVEFGYSISFFCKVEHHDSTVIQVIGKTAKNLTQISSYFQFPGGFH